MEDKIEHSQNKQKVVYETIKYQGEAPPKNLLKIVFEDREIITSLDTFGPNYFVCNIQEMKESYSHPQTGEFIAFREPTTLESISAFSYNHSEFAINDLSCSSNKQSLQAGWIVMGSEGVFVNPPKSSEVGWERVNDERILKSYLNGVKPIRVNKGNIYIVPDLKKHGPYFGYQEYLTDFGYAEYGSFKQGVQSCDTFIRGGLARVLEHTEGEAQIIKEILDSMEEVTAKNFYFDRDNKHDAKVIILGFYNNDRCSQGFCNSLLVKGDWDDLCGGHVFGVLKYKTESMKKAPSRGK